MCPRSALEERCEARGTLPRRVASYGYVAKRSPRGVGAGAQVVDLDKYAELEGVRVLWHLEYWDEPLSGVVEHGGTTYFFQAEPFDWDDPPSVHRLVVYQLSDEELEFERDEHERFRRYVGTHTDYDERGQRRVGEVRPRSEWPRFVGKGRDYAGHEIVGWFLFTRRFRSVEQ